MPEKISAQELQDMLQQGEPVTVIDVRSPDKFAAGHVPGAINIPLKEIQAAKPDIPEDRPVVTYCGGGSSGPAAAEEMEAYGYDSKVMQGFRYWKSTSLPIEGE